MEILILTYNRKDFLKRTIDALHERTRTPFKILVVDNSSTDGTKEYLEGEVGKKISEMMITPPCSICKAYSDGIKQMVTDEVFVMMQDDVIVPDLEPDWQTQLRKLFDDNPDHGSIACRVQKIPNINWTDGDLSPCRKALSAYCRIQRRSDLEAVDYLGDRNWDDMEFVKRIRDKLGKKCSWANNLFCNHLGYMCENKGYGKFKRRWGWSEARMTEYTRKPYPEIDPKTNVPLKRVCK